MGVKYTNEELQKASQRVMKSLNSTHTGQKSFSKPAIPNSLGLQAGKVSKSARKRWNRKQKANLAGKPMENLLNVIPVVEPKLEEENEEQSKKAHTRKAEQRLAQHEINSFKVKSIEELRRSVLDRVK